MRNILFTGCSYVQGNGLEHEYNNLGHFSKILVNNLFGDQHSIDNIGKFGNSNERIFLDSLDALIKKKYDCIFVCWTSFHRYVFWPGLELSDRRTTFTPSKLITSLDEFPDLKGNDLSWSAKKLTELSQMFLLLNHPHYYVRDVVSYVNILIDVAKSKGTKLFFINNILPWDQDYFKYIRGSVIPSMLDNYTNELLNSSNRDDEEINKLYHMMHKQYVDSGGIRETHWLNLYQSFYNMQFDLGDDGMHPGLKSHKKFAEFLTEEFKKHN